MKLDISVKYLLKSLIPSLIILTVFIWDGKITRKMQECFMRSSDALSAPLLFLFNENNTENGNKVYRERILAKRLLYKSSWWKLNCNI